MAQLSGGIVVNLCNVLLYFLLCRKVDTFQRIVARGQLVVSARNTVWPRETSQLGSHGAPTGGLLRP